MPGQPRPGIRLLLAVIGILCGHAACGADSLWSAVTTVTSDKKAEQRWSTITREDVQAAYNVLEANHPAALAEVRDVTFASTLAESHAKALARAARVTSYAGYVATLGAFAGEMGDGHIWSQPLYQPAQVNWAGIVAARRGSDWVVAEDLPDVTGMELKGAQIIGCDGRTVAQLAREVLSYHATISDEAAQVLRGAWLLFDDGNPFVHRPQSCEFKLGGRTVRRTLDWTLIRRDSLFRQYWKSPVGKAGFGVRRSGKGYWIAIESLEAEAGAVVDAVKREEPALRAAPYVVIDLRGNGGGDDAYGTTLAKELYGPQYVQASVGNLLSEDAGCKEVYRASAGNILGLAKIAAWMQATGDLHGSQEDRDAVRAMKSAMAAGHSLTGGIDCRPGAARPAVRPASLMRGEVFVLTDAACFSSCINVVDVLRRLGAVQIGQVTGADTHYTEVRQVLLPSGLSVFSTLQGIDPTRPRSIGPFVPRGVFEGDMADTARLESWVATLAAKTAGS